jgi:DinB family protein
MRDVEILTDLIEKLSRDVRAEVVELSQAELDWQPDSEANGIGVTVWHFSRWLDVLATRALADRPAGQELWQTGGWAARSGYDPHGVGYEGLGVLTGYTLAEVAAIPRLPAGDLLEYLDQVCTALRERLLALPEGGLYQPAPGLGGRRTPYQWVRSILMGCFGHVGEIEALKAMYGRRMRQVAA